MKKLLSQEMLENCEPIYEKLSSIYILKGKSKSKFVPKSSCHCQVLGLSDGSILLYSEKPIVFKNGKKPTGSVFAIEAVKGENSLWKNEFFRHDFSEKSKPKITYLANNAILIQSEIGKKLWRPFQYSPEDLELEPEYYKSKK
jgi:hypothetical protein